MGKKKTNNRNSLVLFRWTVLVIIVIIAVFALTSKFTTVSEQKCRDNVAKEIRTTVATYALRYGGRLNTILATGEGAATSLASYENLTDKKKAYIAAAIERTVPEIYFVVITDTSGDGITSTGMPTNMRSKPYYTTGKDITYVDNDKFHNRPAYLDIVPYSTNDGEYLGNIYMFINPDAVNTLMPTQIFGGSLGNLVISGDGTIVCHEGTSSSFMTEENLFDSMSTSEMDLLPFSQVKHRTANHEATVSNATRGSEYKTIAISPIGINDWMLVVIMSGKYYDTLVSGQMDTVHALVTSLAVAMAIFLVLIVVLIILDRIKFDKEKDNLEDKADTDLLTGLNNKIATERKIQEFMEENPDAQCMFFLFDIDNFKKINDTMGHAFGDEVLRTLGHQLTTEFRASDIIGRLGGDEFVLLLKYIKTDEQLEKEGVRITNFFHQFQVGDYVKYSATASIGAVVVPRDAKDFESAYKAADKALYEAKRRGKNQLVVYSDVLSDVESIRVATAIDSDQN